MKLRRELPILDPLNHPRRYVSLRIAAKYLEVDEKTFRKYVDSGLLAYVCLGSRRRFEVTELLAFERRQRRTA